MSRYIITIESHNLWPSIDIECETVQHLREELTGWLRIASRGTTIEVFGFDDSTLDYDLLDRIEL